MVVLDDVDLANKALEGCHGALDDVAEGGVLHGLCASCSLNLSLVRWNLRSDNVIEGVVAMVGAPGPGHDEHTVAPMKEPSDDLVVNVAHGAWDEDCGLRDRQRGRVVSSE